MREIKAKPIDRETFAPYGVYYDMIHPKGYALCGEIHRFYPDRIQADSQHRIGISPIQVKKPDEMLIAAVEYHTTTWEIILPVNDDMILHVSPASGEDPMTELTEAFIVPKGTMVKIHSAIWHLAPLPVHEPELSAIIILPECTYVNDCTVIELPEEKQFKVIL